MAQGYRSGGNDKPARNILLSVKLSNGEYIKCKHGMGLFPNSDAGPLFRGTLKEQYLVEVHDFLGRAIKKGLSVRLAEFGPYVEKKEAAPAKDEWGDTPETSGASSETQGTGDDDIPF